MTDAHLRASEGALYQDRRWPSIARLQYGLFAYPLWLLGISGSLWTGKPENVLLVFVLFSVPIAICEWRLRKMGFVVEKDALVLVRPLNRTRIPWDDIESFQLVRPFAVDYGNRWIGVKRRRRRVVPGATMRVPTVWVAIENRPRWVPPKGPSGLESEAGEVADPKGFLEAQLDTHRNRFPEAVGGGSAARK